MIAKKEIIYCNIVMFSSNNEKKTVNCTQNYPIELIMI
jgi:hypothetical protein